MNAFLIWQVNKYINKSVNDCSLTMINMCQNTQVPGVSRVSLQCSNLVQAAKTHGHHLKHLLEKSPETWLPMVNPDVKKRVAFTQWSLSSGHFYISRTCSRFCFLYSFVFYYLLFMAFISACTCITSSVKAFAELSLHSFYVVYTYITCSDIRCVYVTCSSSAEVGSLFHFRM